jgi:hypothetical protein
MSGTDVKRWTKISLRTLHLLGVAGVGGGVLFKIDEQLWLNYWWLALASGILLMMIDIISNPVWIVQLRGMVIFAKLVLLVFMVKYPDWAASLLIIIIVVSGVISHAPAKIRYYSLYHRRVIESASDSKG